MSRDNMRRDKKFRRCRRGSRLRGHNSVSISDRQLYRDPQRGKIAGVCAGLADYFGMQIWLVRILAVTGLLFMPQIVFFAYLIAIFVVPTKQQLEQSRAEAMDEELDSQQGKQRRFDRLLSDRDDAFSLNSKRRTVRQLKARFDKIDRRIQDLESHVTSPQYELHREFRKM